MQDSWDFTAYTVAFAKSTPAMEPSPTPTSSPTRTGARLRVSREPRTRSGGKTGSATAQTAAAVKPGWALVRTLPQLAPMLLRSPLPASPV
jgi:hypothetical protein